MKVIALIVSGGEGKRFDKKLPKQFFKINKKSILEQSVKKFVDSNLFFKVVVVCNKNFINHSKKVLNEYKLSYVKGGNSRQESVYNGLKSIKKDSPKRRKSFRARHKCDKPGSKLKARYWSCKKW